MNEFLAILPLHHLASLSFMPHGMCYLWKPWLVGLHLVSDGVIALSYFSIPISLVYILRNRADIPFNGIFLLFAAFILCCGTGHAFDIWTLWHPNYWVSGWIRLSTALVSLATAIALGIQIPQILTWPSPSQMENVNQQLQEKITELEQQKTRIRQQKHFLQALLDNLSDGIVSCDRHGVLTLFNKATREFHGLPHKAIPADEWAKYYDLYLPDGKTLMSRDEIPLFRALQGEAVRDLEMMIIPKQGQPHTLLANGDPIIAPDGQKIGAVVAMRDISQLKKIEQALWESQTRFLEIFLHAAVGMAIVALDGSWLEVNPALRQMVGYSEAELQATNFQAITFPEDLDGDLAKVEQLLSGQIASYQMEKRYVRKSGSLVWINLSVSLVKDQNNQPLYFVALIENIDERKQAEQALAQLNDELEQRVKHRTAQLEQVNSLLLATTATLEKRNQELDQFAYAASHDLKAPLRAIANLSEWIEEDLEDKLDDDTRHQMNLLRSRVHRLENLINGLLVYSRIGRLKSEPQEVAVGEMIAEIIDLLDVPDSFQIQIQEEMPSLFTELIPLQQVFNNLISNAIKHSDHDRGQIVISAKEQNNFYEFAVADNGKGIDPKYHERIFTIFSTLEARDSKESTGIGLAIVKKAVENQGGKIEVESQVGAGTTFRFTWKKIQNCQQASKYGSLS